MHEFPNIQAVAKVQSLGEGTIDEKVWVYAKTNNLMLVTKDKDFVDYWERFGPPPKVIKLKIGNCRISAIESLLKNNKCAVSPYFRLFVPQYDIFSWGLNGL